MFFGETHTAIAVFLAVHTVGTPENTHSISMHGTNLFPVVFCGKTHTAMAVFLAVRELLKTHTQSLCMELTSFPLCSLAKLILPWLCSLPFTLWELLKTHSLYSWNYPFPIVFCTETHPDMAVFLAVHNVETPENSLSMHGINLFPVVFCGETHTAMAVFCRSRSCCVLW